MKYRITEKFLALFYMNIMAYGIFFKFEYESQITKKTQQHYLGEEIKGFRTGNRKQLRREVLFNKCHVQLFQ